MHIEIQDVSKSFGRNKVLDHLDLNVPPSSIVALLGENGAGKSTLLRILAGVCVPDGGVVRYDGKVFDREQLDLRKRLHFTPDMPLLYTDQTAAYNISTIGAIYGKSVHDRKEYLTYWLEETGSAALINRKAGLLSRGQMWKVGLGCVAMIEPELWLVDEPFASGMDAIGMGAFRRLAQSLVKNGSTVIYTTQMVGMALDFSDHVCVIRDRKIVLSSAAEDLRQRFSADPDVAEKILRGNLTTP